MRWWPRPRRSGKPLLPRPTTPRNFCVSAPEIVARLSARLGIGVGETTEDGKITLQSVECLCACEHAPMMQVDERYELGLTPEKVDRILEGLR